MDLTRNINGKLLRCGYTTGSCAAGAAGAATEMLLTGKRVEEVGMDTPKGIRLTLDIASALTDILANARGIHIETTGDGLALCRFDLRVRNKEEVDQVMRKIMQISGVLDVRRPAK